jgi:hypothetical protein
MIEYVQVDSANKVDCCKLTQVYFCEDCNKEENIVNVSYKRIDYFHHQPVEFLNLNTNKSEFVT